MLQLGVCTWTFNQPLAKTAAVLQKLGYDGVELLGDLTQYTAAEAAQILGDHGLSAFSLTPADVDIAHPDQPVRDSGVDYYYRLIDFAAALGNPLVSCHGLVGRIAPIATQAQEDDHLRDSVRKIVERAKQSGLRVVFEVLNRYETHQIHNHMQALELVQQINMDNFGILLDAYHMNIEEANPADAIRATDSHLWLYHVADSNRAAVGLGNTDFEAQWQALSEIGYTSPIIIECTAPGPNPFTPEKGGEWRRTIEDYLTISRQWFVNRINERTEAG